MSSEYGHAMDALDWFTANAAVRDLFSLVTGKRPGTGIARDVYEFAPDPSRVIKFELAARSFQNVAEWDLWERVKKAPSIARWFAPCVLISACGVVMLQKRADDVGMQKLPRRVPALFTDLKRGNWGFIDGQLVCRDYGRNLSLEQGLTTRMRKADWW